MSALKCSNYIIKLIGIIFELKVKDKGKGVSKRIQNMKKGK